MEQTQKKSGLQAAMYFIDDNLTVSNPIPDSSSARNMGLKRRHGICTAKPTFDMIGPATRRRVQSEQIYVEWCDDESENDAQ